MSIFKKKSPEAPTTISNEKLVNSITNANYLVNLASDINIMKTQLVNQQKEIADLKALNNTLKTKNQQLIDKLEGVKKLLV